MMTEEQAIALGKRAVAAGWRVWPGQLSLSGIRCTVTPIPLSPRPDDIPDFRDPATLGILRAQVIALVPGAVELSFAAWEMPRRPEVRQMYWQDKECMCCKAFDVPHPYTDRWHIEALVAALEAAKAGKL